MPASRAQRTKTAERRSKAVQLRIAGADWETIATVCDYASRGAACTDVTRAMEAATAEATRNADVLRHLELTRLDRLQRAFWPAAIGGGEGAADAARTVLGIIDRRCKLLGLAAPSKVEVVSLGAIEAEIARLEADMPDADPADLIEPAGVDLPDVPVP